jgi:protein-histidine pros-kinase
MLVLRIADTGPGIASEDRERIFQAFERLSEGMNAATEGTGLGLYLSRRLAEKLGGSLRLDPDHHPGSAFELSLPDR